MRRACLDGGWVYGADTAFPLKPSATRTEQREHIPCNQLFCDNCKTPVKHLDELQAKVLRPPSFVALYESEDPAVWLPYAKENRLYRLYFCRCGWYSSAGGTPVTSLDTAGVDHWRCAGHSGG